MPTVWDYATKRTNLATNGIEGVCGRGKIIKYVKSSVTALKTHLKLHGIIIEKDQQAEEGPAPKKMKTIKDFIKKQTLPEILADLATDGISIRAITRNNYIRNSIQRDGFKMPKNESDVVKLLISEYDEKREKMKTVIELLLQKEAKFSMSVDTTVRGRRFFGINLHDSVEKKTWKTGLNRILGSCSAEKMIEMIKEHLSSFNINYERDLIASTQDGAAVNKKYIRILDVIGQFCLNHAIHLAVTDTLYKKKSNISEVEDYDINSIGETDEFIDASDLEFIEFNTCEDIEFHEILEQARKVVKYIKLSSIRNQVYQKKVKEKLNKEIELNLDVKTR